MDLTPKPVFLALLPFYKEETEIWSIKPIIQGDKSRHFKGI